MPTEIAQEFALQKLGVQIETIPPKRKDGLSGKKYSFQLENNQVRLEVAALLAQITKPDGYIYDIVIIDNELGQVATSNSGNSGKNKELGNPVEAIRIGMASIRETTVNSWAMDEALRKEAELKRSLDMAENAAIHQRVSEGFIFQTESVEVTCRPASWNWADKN